MKNRSKYISMVLAKRLIAFSHEPDWYAFTPDELAGIIERFGLPAWWWTPWISAQGDIEAMKPKPPEWLRLQTDIDENYIAAMARKAALRKDPAAAPGDEERWFIRTTIGLPPFGRRLPGNANEFLKQEAKSNRISTDMNKTVDKTPSCPLENKSPGLFDNTTTPPL